MLRLNTWTITYVAKVMLPTSQNFYEGDMSKYREYWTPVNTLYAKCQYIGAPAVMPQRDVPIYWLSLIVDNALAIGDVPGIHCLHQ